MTHIQSAPPLIRKPVPTRPRGTDATSLQDLDSNSFWNRLQRRIDVLENNASNTPQREGEDSPARRIPERRMPDNKQAAWKHQAVELPVTGNANHHPTISFELEQL